MDSKATDQKKADKFTIVLFIIYALLTLGVILFKLPFRVEDSERAINLIPLRGSFTSDGALRLAEVIENILIFIPLGIFARMIKTNWTFAKRVLLIACVTVSLEAIQFIFAMGKSDITDVLGNTLGGLIGIGLYVLLSKIFKARTNKVVNTAVLIVIFCVIVAFVFLLRRSR